MMSMGYYFKGDAAKLAAVHAPFSAGETKQLKQVYDRLEQEHAHIAVRIPAQRHGCCAPSAVGVG